MRYTLRSGRIIEYNGTNYAIKIYYVVGSSDFTIMFYSESKLAFTRDQVSKIMQDAFKVNLDLKINNECGKTRRSLTFDVAMDVYQRVTEVYSKMKKCIIYGDKLIDNRRLNAFKNITFDKKTEVHLVRLLLCCINDDDVFVFFNGKIITKETWAHDILRNASSYNSIGVFL